MSTALRVVKPRIRYVAGMWVPTPVHQVISVGSRFLYELEWQLRESKSPRLTDDLLAVCEHTCVVLDAVLAALTNGAIHPIFGSQFTQRIEPMVRTGKQS